MNAPMGMEDQPAKSSNLKEIIGAFLRLGFTAFGGPAVHVALMEDEFVHRRKWLDRQHFLDLVSAMNFIPGPNSTELAIHIGQVRAGIPGLVAAGVCFITPAMLIILPLGWMYVTYGAKPQVEPIMRSIGAAVVAVIAAAILRLMKPMWRDPFAMTVAAMAIVAAFAMRNVPQFQPEITILFAAAVVGIIVRRHQRAALLAVVPPGLWEMCGVFLKIGLTLFGSGYVLINYLQSSFVDQRGWLTKQQIIDAIAIGQFTPGPLLTAATFIGYVLGSTHFAGGTAGGIVGGVLATVAIFFPSFLLVGMLAPVLQRLRRMPSARGALDGMNAAVVGLLIVIALRLGWVAVRTPDTGEPDLLNAAILAGTMAFLLRGINATWLILSAGIIGLLRWYFAEI